LGGKKTNDCYRSRNGIDQLPQANVQLDIATRIFALAILLVVSGQGVPDERTFQFSGTLGGGDAQCGPSDRNVCGPYTRTLTIDDSQAAMEWIAGHAYDWFSAPGSVCFAPDSRLWAKIGLDDSK
jgi:hypothetical protein